MYSKEALNIVLQNETLVNNKWYISKPFEGPFIKVFVQKLKDAFSVLTGKAFAVEWK